MDIIENIGGEPQLTVEEIENLKNKGNMHNRLFVENMKELGYEPKDYKDFICIGSSKTHPDIPICINPQLPELTNYCVCEKEIVENCWIYHIPTEKVVTIGNHCVKRFFPKDSRKGKRCDICLALHQNRKENICNNCVDKIKTKKLEEQIKKDKEINSRYKKYCKDCNIKVNGFVRCFSCNKKYQEKKKQPYFTYKKVYIN